jgi:copper chaperone NosL
MKKFFVYLLFLLLPFSFILPPVQGAEPPAGDVIKAPACPLCGMNRNKFNFSRTFIVYDDGSTFGGCSLHCAAIDMAVNIDKAPVEIWVGDYNTKNLIDAEKAFWVIGGKKMGVMTKRAKWAFVTKEAADKFIAQYGGKLSNLKALRKPPMKICTGTPE